MNRRTRWLIVSLLLLAPYLVVMAAGWVWLFEHHVILWWALAATLCAVAGRLIFAGWRRRTIQELPRTVEPSPSWPPRDLAAWNKVEQLAAKVRQENLPLNNPERWWNLLQEVLDVVARHYFPNSENPRLETPVPHLAEVIALVAQDLGRFSQEKIPGSHLLTINDLRWLFGLGAKGYRAYPWIYNFWRLVRFGHPISAAMREVSDWVTGGLIDRSADEIKNWALDFCIKRAGYYAIELYSGRMVVAGQAAGHVTQASLTDLAQAEQYDAELDEEPLRVLVLGQVKSGKSSLINALFGNVRAATDVLPATRNVTPYLIDDHGIRRAILLDTAGYEDPAGSRDPFAGLKDQVLACDLVLVVCHTRHAARDPDRRLLDQLRALYDENRDRKPPPTLAVLTHIDQLRPVQEWQPPYDLSHGKGTKVRQILDAMEAVAEALGLNPGQVVPVRLDAGHEYNVVDGLVPAILHALPDAQAAKAGRVLKDFQRQYNRRLLWEQAISAGRLALTGGSYLLNKSGERFKGLTRG